MAEKSSRSAGWRFQSTRREQLNVIEFHAQSDPLDTDTLNALTERIQEIEGDDVSLFFKFLPSIDQLISQIPFTLPLLEALYLKCELIHAEEGARFPAKELMCEQLFCQLVWWAAYSEQLKNTASMSRKKLPRFEDVEPCISTIVGIFYRQLPDLVERAQADRRQLAACLECLGCHGLVNCSTGLIRMCDAAHLEVGKHIDKLKNVNSKIKDIQEENRNAHGKHTNPSVASHQRQMSLRLSEVFERLKHNEAIEHVLDEAMTNHHLSSLLRIVKKRIASDRLLIGLFNAFTRAAPDDFSFIQLDPIVAQLIVIFSHSYEKLLAMYRPLIDCDSGCSAEGSVDENKESSNETVDRQPPIDKSPSPSKSTSKGSKRSEVRRQCELPKLFRIKKNLASSNYRADNSKNCFGKQMVSHHRSLLDISNLCRTVTPIPIKTSKSLGTLNKIVSEALMKQGSSYSLLNSRKIKSSTSQSSMRKTLNSSAKQSTDDVSIQLKEHIHRLQMELSQARNEISRLYSQRQQTVSSSKMLWPESDHPNVVSYYSYSSTEEVMRLVERFSDLFRKSRTEVLPALNKLDDFRDSDELQIKTVLSVIVLTYRSVRQNVNRKRLQVWEIMNEGCSRGDSEDNSMLDIALYRHLYRRAKSQHGLQNAKEVTSQIWRTLYDFTSLKTCNVFNKFVLECVDISWDLVAGLDGRCPRLLLEYEGIQFDTEKHTRTTSSSAKSTKIRQFLWPALIDQSTSKILLKAIVIT